MKIAFLSSRLPALALAAGYLSAAAPVMAQATDQTAAPAAATAGEEPANRRSTSYLDLSAGAGYSSNPLLQLHAKSSAFGRVSLYGYHSWNSERGSTWLSGYVEDTTYLNGGYGSKLIFRLNAHTDQAVSEKVRVFADLNASSDVAGQLANRFTPTPVVIPPVINPPPGTLPEFLNLGGREYVLGAQFGASITAGARSSISLTAGASHGFFTGGNNLADYTTYNVGIGYNTKVSEHTSIGANVNFQRQDYHGSDYANVVNPAVTVTTQFASDVQASGSVGLLAIYEHRAGRSDRSYTPSFSGSLCKNDSRTQLCADVSRTAQAPLGVGILQGAAGATINTNFDLSYRRRVSEFSTVYATVSATRNSTVQRLQNGSFQTTYLTGLVGYDHSIGHRLFLGVSGGARKLYQTGPDPKTDFNGNIYLRYRLGDLL